jgi:hypothetical protein
MAREADPLRALLDRTGMSREDGSLDRLFGTADVVRIYREVTLLDGEHGPTLHVADPRDFHWQKARRDSLAGFLRIAEAKPKAVLEFARRRGMLELCQHMVPAQHNSHRRSVVMRANRSHDLKRYTLGNGRIRFEAWEPKGEPGGPFGCTPICVEPVAVWQELAQEARMVLWVAAKLRLGQGVTPRDGSVAAAACAAIDRFEQEHPSDEWESRSWLQLQWLWDRVDCWLLAGDVGPRVEVEHRWEGTRMVGGTGKLQLVWYAQSLFEALARDLALLVTSTAGVATCAGCGTAFIPKRKPIAGRNTWCDDPECRKAAGREYTRRSRGRRNHAAPGGSSEDAPAETDLAPDAPEQGWLAGLRRRLG